MPSPLETKRLIRDEMKLRAYGNVGAIGDDSRLELVELFERRPLLNTSAANNIANKHFEADAEADWANSDVVYAEGGGIRITTPDTTPAANDHAGVRPHVDTNQTAWAATDRWNSAHLPYFETRISLPSIADVALIAGFKEDTALPADLAVLGSDDNACLIAFDEDNSTSGVNFLTVTNVAGADTIEDSGVLVEASTDFKLRIELDSDRVPHFYINDKLVGSGPAMTDDVDLIPFVGVMTDTTTKKSMDIRYVRCSRQVA